jgi:hypothetical protein
MTSLADIAISLSPQGLLIVGLEGKLSAQTANKVPNQQNPCHSAQKRQAIVPQESARKRFLDFSTKPAQSGHYAHHVGANQLPTAVQAKLRAFHFLPDLPCRMTRLKTS